MGTISSGVDDINNIFRQSRLDQERMSLQRSEDARLNEQAKAARAKQDELDRIDKLNKDADAAGAKVFDGFRAQHILEGGNQDDYAPTPGHMDAAYRARGTAFLKAGDMGNFLKNHAEGAVKRAGVRDELVKSAMASGNPMAVMKAMNQTVDNGITLQSIEPVTLPSQDPSGGMVAYRATYVDTNGKPREEMLTANDISKRAAYVLSNPGEVAKQELAYDLNRQKVQGTIAEQNNKGEQDRQTESVQIKGRKEVAQVETQGRLQVEGAKGSQDRKTAGHKDGLERAKPVMFKPGDELKAPMPNKDGAIEYKTVGRSSAAKGGKAGLSSKDLNTMVINNFGVMDPGTGRQVGAESTAKISAAAEQLMQANPELGANEAIVTAAQDLGLNIKAKN